MCRWLFWMHSQNHWACFVITEITWWMDLPFQLAASSVVTWTFAVLVMLLPMSLGWCGYQSRLDRNPLSYGQRITTTTQECGTPSMRLISLLETSSSHTEALWGAGPWHLIDKHLSILLNVSDEMPDLNGSLYHPPPEAMQLKLWTELSGE